MISRERRRIMANKCRLLHLALTLKWLLHLTGSFLMQYMAVGYSLFHYLLLVISIWKLSTNIEYRTLSELFRIGRTTVWEVVHDTYQHIVVNLFLKDVKIPNGDRLKELVESFELTKGFPQAVGAIDSTHIPIIWPEQSPADHYNWERYYSIIKWEVVDFRGVFMDVCIGWPGKVHDAHVFSNSDIYKKE